MMWDVLTGEEKNIILLRLLARVCKADETLRVEEFAYLMHVCTKLGLDPEVLRTIVLSETESEEILPSEEHDRMGIMYHMLFTMASDHDVNSKEVNLIHRLAFRLGFSEAMTRDFIDVMKNQNIQDLPISMLLDVVRKHNN
jgi:uncharacterized tellurite resistance protein B-like protein